MLEVVAGVGWGDPVERFAEGVFQGVDRAEFALSTFVFDFREHLFDRVKVGTVGRQIHDGRIHSSHCLSCGLPLLRGQVGHHEGVAGTQSGASCWRAYSAK